MHTYMILLIPEKLKLYTVLVKSLEILSHSKKWQDVSKRTYLTMQSRTSLRSIQNIYIYSECLLCVFVLKLMNRIISSLCVATSACKMCWVQGRTCLSTVLVLMALMVVRSRCGACSALVM